MNNFNLIAQLKSEIKDFEQNRVNIAGSQDENKGFKFSQWETLNTIELYYNSKFESGEIDSEGQRKAFLNICQFKADVGSKQVDIDVKDFVFVPENRSSEWGAFFLTKKFKKWAKDRYFGQVINEIVNDYPKYGSAVLKKVGDCIERVPLMTLKNQQDAKSLKDAKYVIEVHKKWTYADVEKMEEWDKDNLNVNWDEEFDVYERYGRVPLDWYKKEKGLPIEDGDDKKSIDTMSIIVCGQAKDDKEAILFLEEIEERPYEEVHWKRVDGRWLGVGEIENQFENQIFRNMITNLRRRGLLWSGKKIFQSTDTEIAKNLVRDVKDGQVLKIMPNGNITQVNTTTQSLSEFEAAAREIDENSNQKSFTYEVATGEALPSGTPFRLGVIMTNAVNAHFALKRENLGLFFERVVFELLFPIFKKENRKAEEMFIPTDEEDMMDLLDETIAITTWKVFKDVLLSGGIPNIEEIKLKVKEKIQKQKRLSFALPEKLWDQLKVNVQLVITGENVNLEKRIETLTNLYNILSQTNPIEANKVLSKILALTGEKWSPIAEAPQPMAQQGTQPQMPQSGGSDALMGEIKE